MADRRAESREGRELEHVPQAYAGVVESRDSSPRLYEQSFADTAPARAPKLRKKTVDSVDLQTVLRALRDTGDEGPYVRPTWFWSIVINTFYYSGIRRLQLVGLTWKDIDFDAYDSPKSHVEQDTSRVVHSDRPAIAPRAGESLPADDWAPWSNAA